MVHMLYASVYCLLCSCCLKDGFCVVCVERGCTETIAFGVLASLGSKETGTTAQHAQTSATRFHHKTRIRRSQRGELIAGSIHKSLDCEWGTTK